MTKYPFVFYHAVYIMVGMRVLKAAICLAITTLIFFAPAFFRAPAHAAALPKYAYTELDSTVYFYSENDRNKTLFEIPQTYCVEILSEQGDWYYVKYADDNGVYRAVYGYVLKSEVTPTDVPPENIYLHLTISVIYRTDDVGDLLNGLDEIEITAAYYGAYSVGGVRYAYVFANGKLGYVKYTLDSYPKNDLPKTAPTFAQGGGSDSRLITAVVITLISAAAIVILYFASKKPKPLT